MNRRPENFALVQALVDNELDAANAAMAEAHVKTCEACGAELQRALALREHLARDFPQSPAPAALRAAIAQNLRLATRAAEAPQSQSAYRGRWFAGGAASAMAAAAALVVALPQLTAPGLDEQLVAGHVRSQLAGHLIDVATSDRHVVKPWFNGKIDFAPPVVDLADQGFPLAGGRLDYLEGRVIPALVYRRRLHVINLFIRPARPAFASPGSRTARNGYSLIRWATGGLEYWAVSDLPPAELDQFSALFRERTADQTEP